MQETGRIASRAKLASKAAVKRRKKLTMWVMLALLAAVISGCGAADSSSKEAAGAQAKAIADSKSRSDAPQAAAEGSNAAKEQLATAAATAAGEAKSDANKPADSFNGGASAAGPDAYSAMDRKIIYKASLTMQVDQYAEAQSRIESAVKQAGGYILQFNENETTYEKNGNFVIKVPASGFSSLLGQLESIHPSTHKNMQGQDVSEEFVDLAARLKAKQVVESRLIAFMEKASKTDELLAFSNELGKTQEEIERIKGRMRYLEQNVAYSTIELRLTQKLGSAAVIQSQDHGPLFQRAFSALNGSAAVLTMIFQWIVIVLAAVLPVAIVAAVILVPLWLLSRTKRKKLLELRRKLSEENVETTLNRSKSEGPRETQN
ncbi:DUF4349 domain-containing protein [Paenibacillus rigui]|uniref:DUF4349 domain-containing protein n=1 Tax=Paenibacillus rigui TaxID=554312 RepID=A0A229UR47_9BACL|nr:DUF4349 domain-containing protein [Paenibacillus rigui]OXM86057.1 hypothetical protein CF651_12630 [Paenibacillus rigui]